MGSKRRVRDDDDDEGDMPEQMGTCHPAVRPVLDDTSALAADDLPLGVRKHKRAKVDAMPPRSEYELQCLEKIQQNNQALPLPNFRLPRTLATRAPNPSALPMRRMVVGPGRPEFRRNPRQHAGCTGAGYEGNCCASACDEGHVRSTGQADLGAFAHQTAEIFYL